MAIVMLRVKTKIGIPLGCQVNQQTSSFLKSVHGLLKVKSVARGKKVQKMRLDKTALIIINAQNGLLNPTLGNRSNSDAEINIGQLLRTWRNGSYPVIHIRHASNNPDSAFYVASRGFEFITDLSPLKTELIIDKSKSSAFTDTSLLTELTSRSIEAVVITGFTADECIDATARQASELHVGRVFDDVPRR
jgi:nicotinamidase-related amidase